jgi:hypothetical protein
MLRCDAGLPGLAIGRRGWSRRVLALVAGVALALSVGAVRATSASASSVITACEIEVGGQPYPMLVTNEVEYGSGHPSYWEDNLPGISSLPSLKGTTLPAYTDLDVNSNSIVPSNHCSIHLWFALQTPDGSGWSPALEAYVYDPNSGHNSASATATGDFAQRTCVQTNPIDRGDQEILGVSVLDPGYCGTARPYGLSVRPA